MACKDLVEALEEIEDHSGMTILGGADTRSTTQAHQDGAAKAFERAAEVAHAALANHKCEAEAEVKRLEDEAENRSEQHSKRLGGVFRRASKAEEERDAAREALEALMDCNRGSIPDEVWAKAREVVEAA